MKIISKNVSDRQDNHMMQQNVLLDVELRHRVPKIRRLRARKEEAQVDLIRETIAHIHVTDFNRWASISKEHRTDPELVDKASGSFTYQQFVVIIRYHYHTI